MFPHQRETQKLTATKKRDLVSRRYNTGRSARYGPLSLKCTAADHAPGGGVQYQAVLVCR